MRSTHTFLIDYSTVDKRSKLRINAGCEAEASEKAVIYLEKKYRGYHVNGIEREKAKEERVFNHLFEELVDYVIRCGSHRHNCESEKDALELAANLKTEFSRLGRERDFDAWVFGKAVHIFPVTSVPREEFEKRDAGCLNNYFRS